MGHSVSTWLQATQETSTASFSGNHVLWAVDGANILAIGGGEIGSLCILQRWLDKGRCQNRDSSLWFPQETTDAALLNGIEYRKQFRKQWGSLMAPRWSGGLKFDSHSSASILITWTSLNSAFSRKWQFSACLNFAIAKIVRDHLAWPVSALTFS